ncbi:glycosyltransferase family 4 protein [Oceanicola sp. 22II-s10i]|uniref:glycosyltransferase family 4 protein n=1 Tax=Oceanicola sp. 22II-s10i TaxID=1317116 RepID=UPI000B5248C0|nr:glycosyltransferase family 4 protein [Oceanicola sp. 22II-s10i]
MTKPRVLLCLDTPNWAYDNICDQIERFHGHDFEFERYYMAGVVGYPQVFLNQIFNLKPPFDLIHFFWREDVQHLLNPEALYTAATRFRIRPEDLFDRISRPVITASVYDHLHLEPEAFPWRERAFWFTDGYAVSSSLLEGIYRDIDSFPDPITILTDGVDLDRFGPVGLERLTDHNRPLRVGWVGNSAWGAEVRDDPKGLHSILNPAIEALAAEGVTVEPYYADSSVARRTRDEMVAYYGDIDVLVCSSEIEGTPNPVLEAMASGVPVISTRVGIVPEIFGPKQQGYILPERSVEEMAAALRRLAMDRAKLAELSAENLIEIRKFSWEKTTAGWPDFWHAATVRNREGQRTPLKRYMLQERYAAWYSDTVKQTAKWRVASGPARIRRSLHQSAVDWIYRTPERAAFINRLRGRA